MSVPCVIGRPVTEGRRILEEAGVKVTDTQQTQAPGRALAGPLRVIRQRLATGGVELTVAASVPLITPESEG